MTVKLTKQQTGQVEVLAEKFEMTVEDVTSKFVKLLNSEKLRNRDKKVQSTMGMRILLAQLSSQKDKKSFGGKTEDVTIRVEMKEEPTEFKRAGGEKGFRSSVYCTARADAETGGEDDIFFTVLTLWGDANECNPEMVVGKTYDTKAVRNGNVLSMNNPEELTEVDTELPAMNDIITDAYPIVELENAELNVSADWNDLKLIKGVISGAWTKETRNGNMMGFLKIISEEGADSMVVKFSRIYEQVNYWDDGSLVYVLGQITPAVYEEESGELQYDTSAWGNLIVPIEAFEKEVELDEPDEEPDENAEDDEEYLDNTDSDWEDEDWT